MKHLPKHVHSYFTYGPKNKGLACFVRYMRAVQQLAKSYNVPLLPVIKGEFIANTEQGTWTKKNGERSQAAFSFQCVSQTISGENIRKFVNGCEALARHHGTNFWHISTYSNGGL